MKIRHFLTAVLLLTVASVVPAAIVQYNDRGSWEGAVGGPGDGFEDFSGFAADTPFRAGPVTLSIGEIQQVGFDTAFRNQVDAPPFQFTDNNGTTHASCYTNAAEAGPMPPGTGGGAPEDTPSPDQDPDDATDVRVTFTDAVSAWGADFYGVLGGELLAVDVLGAGDVVLATLDPVAQDTFLGFVADGGEEVIAVLLHSATLNPGGGGEGFGMDDISTESGGGGPVPAVSEWGTAITVVLLLTISSFVLLRRRART